MPGAGGSVRGKNVGGRRADGVPSITEQFVLSVIRENPSREWHVKDVQSRLKPVTTSGRIDQTKWAENTASRGLAALDRRGIVSKIGRGKYRLVNLENSVLPLGLLLVDHFVRATLQRFDAKRAPESVRPVPLARLAQNRHDAIRDRVSRRVSQDLGPILAQRLLIRLPKEIRPSRDRILKAIAGESYRLESLVRAILARESFE
jgi:hypothetical protein